MNVTTVSRTERIASSHGAWLAVAMALFLLTILRGIRMPSDWAFSHFLFAYDEGFVKRGLLGEIVRRIDIPFLASYEFFAVVSGSLLLAVLFLLALTVRDLIRRGTVASIGIALLFVTSTGVVFLAHLIGYSDVIGLLIVLIALRIGRFRSRLLFLFPAITFLLLVHEASLILFCPLLLLTLVIDRDGLGRSSRIWWAAGLGAWAAAVTIFVSGSTIDLAAADAMYRDRQEASRVALRPDAFEVLGRSVDDNRAIMVEVYGEMKRYVGMIDSFLVTIPLVVLFLYVAVRLMRRNERRRIMIPLLLGAALSPLAMHLLGWDMHRWNAQMVITSYLVLHVAMRASTEKIDLPDRLVPIGVLLLALNGMSALPLFDGYKVRQFPFIEEQMEWNKRNHR